MGIGTIIIIICLEAHPVTCYQIIAKFEYEDTRGSFGYECRQGYNIVSAGLAQKGYIVQDWKCYWPSVISDAEDVG